DEWEFYRNDSAANERFIDFQDAVSDQMHIPIILRTLKIAEAKHLVDVAGGKGSLACAILTKHGHMEGVVFDQPHMRQAVIDRIGTTNLTGRCQFAEGSMLDFVPGGADLYTIKHAIHDWNDEAVLRIFRNIRKAMPNRARLVVIEGILDQ